jgi:hypothetical protein
MFDMSQVYEWLSTPLHSFLLIFGILIALHLVSRLIKVGELLERSSPQRMPTGADEQRLRLGRTLNTINTILVLGLIAVILALRYFGREMASEHVLIWLILCFGFGLICGLTTGLIPWGGSRRRRWRQPPAIDIKVSPVLFVLVMLLHLLVCLLLLWLLLDPHFTVKGS